MHNQKYLCRMPERVEYFIPLCHPWLPGFFTTDKLNLHDADSQVNLLDISPHKETLDSL